MSSASSGFTRSGLPYPSARCRDKDRGYGKPYPYSPSGPGTTVEGGELVCPLHCLSGSHPDKKHLRLQTRRDYPFRVSVCGTPIDQLGSSLWTSGDPASKVFDGFEAVRLPRRKTSQSSSNELQGINRMEQRMLQWIQTGGPRGRH